MKAAKESLFTLLVMMSIAIGPNVHVVAEMPLVSDLKDGRFEVAISSTATDLQSDSVAAQKLKEYLVRVERIYPRRPATAPTGSVEDNCVSLQRGILIEGLDLCRAAIGTKANLTQILAVGAVSKKLPKEYNYSPVVEALLALRHDFPKSWQAQVSPLIAATLVNESAGPAEVNRDKAIRILEESLRVGIGEPDFEDPEVKHFFRVYLCTPPLKASYLVALAKLWYEAACFPGEGATELFDLSALDRVREVCASIISEFPQDQQANWARQMVHNRIPALERYGAQTGGLK